VSPFLSLEFLGKRLNWNSFYFDPGMYSDAFKVASEPRAEHRPIIIEGAIRRILEPTPGKKLWTIQFGMKQSESGAVVAPKILVYEDSELLQSLKVDDRIAAIGYWEVEDGFGKGTTYHNLKLLWPVPNQVVKLDD
jgi:hypothetical protein